jgi:hypothetical protein
MTGRAAGFCAGNPVPGYMNPVGGRGYRGRGRGFWGRGGGRGWRNWFYTTGSPGWARFGQPVSADISNTPDIPKLNPEQELASLRQQAEYLEDSIEGIRKRIEELEKAKMEK